MYGRGAQRWRGAAVIGGWEWEGKGKGKGGKEDGRGGVECGRMECGRWNGGAGVRMYACPSPSPDVSTWGVWRRPLCCWRRRRRRAVHAYRRRRAGGQDTCARPPTAPSPPDVLPLPLLLPPRPAVAAAAAAAAALPARPQVLHSEVHEAVRALAERSDALDVLAGAWLGRRAWPGVC